MVEIKVIPTENNKFTIILLNTTQALIITSVKDVPYANVGEEVQKILKKYF